MTERNISDIDIDHHFDVKSKGISIYQRKIFLIINGYARTDMRHPHLKYIIYPVAPINSEQYPYYSCKIQA